MNNIGTFYSLAFDSEEEGDLLDFLKELGYTPDKDGLKEFILDEVYDEENGSEGTSAEEIAQKVADSPIVGTVVGKVAEQIFGKAKFKW